MPKFTVEERLEQSLKRSKANVFLRKDFDKLGGYDQVGRALREATKKGKLVKAGYGVYVKARESSISGKPVPIISGLAGAREAGREGRRGQLGACQSSALWRHLFSA